MHNSHFRIAIVALLIATIMGCHRYAVSVNEQVIYEPPALFKDYQLADASLLSCVRATIVEKNITRAADLQQLFCPEGNIVQLDGLHTFKRLRTLRLASNKIVSIAPLAALSGLERVNIANNSIIDFSPLKELRALRYVDAQGNLGADCDSLVIASENSEVKRPQHCAR